VAEVGIDERGVEHLDAESRVSDVVRVRPI
jgi:hypothetical protein